MKKTSPIAVACASACSLLFTLPARAEPVSFMPTPGATDGGGSLVAQIPVRSLAKVDLPRGIAVISGHSIEIDAVPDWLFDREPVFTGVVIYTRAETQGPNMVVRGLAYFNDGSWIRNIAAPLDSDTFVTRDGAEIVGHVQALMSDGIEILQESGGRRKLAYDDITNVVSPRAFLFATTARTIKLDTSSPAMQGEAVAIAFGAPAGQRNRVVAALAGKPKVPQSHLPGTEGGVSNAYIVGASMLDLATNVVAPAVYWPILWTESRTKQLEIIKHFADFELNYPVPQSIYAPSPLSPNPGTLKIP